MVWLTIPIKIAIFKNTSIDRFANTNLIFFVRYQKTKGQEIILVYTCI